MHSPRNGEVKLFDTTPWNDYKVGFLSRAKAQAMSMDKDIFDANSVNQIVEYITPQYLIEPIVLDIDSAENDLLETRVESISDWFGLGEERTVMVDALKMISSIPFSGNEDLFYVQPSVYSLTNFLGEISDGKLVLSTITEQFRAESEAMKESMDKQVTRFENMISNVNNDVRLYNSEVSRTIQDAVEQRLAQIEKISSIKSALKIPMERATSPSPLNKVAINVQKIEPLSTKKDEAGAYISDDDYAAILESIRSMGAAMESTNAANSQDEETLRDILLVGLAASIKNGLAGGELFHKGGKADISIPFDNKATFVAECKFWQGAVYIDKGITQLLRYTTWRDAKTALIIFKKSSASFSDIQKKIPGIFNQRKDFVSESPQNEGEWRFTLVKPDDPGRHVDVHVMMFDVHEANE